MKLHPMLLSAVNYVLALTGSINLMAGTSYLAVGDVKSGGAAVAAGLLLVLAASIERFESLKGLGIEAKTRKIEDKLSEAEVILTRMRRLAELCGTTLIQLYARADRWDSAPTPQEAYELSMTVKHHLGLAGSAPETIRASLAPWATAAAFDVARSMVDRYQKRLQDVVVQLQRQVEAVPRPLAKDGHSYGELIAHFQEAGAYARSIAPRIETWTLHDFGANLRRLVDQVPLSVIRQHPDIVGLLGKEVDAWVPEMEYLADNLDFRDPEKWFAAIVRAHEGT